MNKRRQSVIAARIGGVVILASLVLHAQSPSPTAIVEPEAYRIYAMLLARMAGPQPNTIIVQTETVTQWSCVPKGKPLEEDWRPVWDNFKVENDRVRTLSLQLLTMQLPHQFVAAADGASTLPGPSFWVGFYEKFPASRGYYAVSAVGFDETKTRAIVYAENQCGLLCGRGVHHLLEKVNDQWVSARVDVRNCQWRS